MNGDDVYFVANHRRRMEKITATFRVTGKVPVLWDAETGILEFLLLINKRMEL